MPKKEEPPLPYSVLHHLFVPNHEILTKRDAGSVLKQYSASPEQLPCILSSDPAVKDIGAKPGDIIKISRRSETAGIATYYRLVVIE